jgi:hypothetical protein
MKKWLEIVEVSEAHCGASVRSPGWHGHCAEGIPGVFRKESWS